MDCNGAMQRDGCETDEQTDRLVRQLRRDLDLIEVARLEVVDRRPRQVTEIAHAIDGIDPRDLGVEVGRQVRREPVLVQHAAGDREQVDVVRELAHSER